MNWKFDLIPSDEWPTIKAMYDRQDLQGLREYFIALKQRGINTHGCNCVLTDQNLKNEIRDAFKDEKYFRLATVQQQEQQQRDGSEAT